MVEEVVGVISSYAAGAVQVWNIAGPKCVNSGVGQNYVTGYLWAGNVNYCQFEETMGGMQWLSRFVR
jgi:hypothetical protein